MQKMLIGNHTRLYSAFKPVSGGTLQFGSNNTVPPTEPDIQQLYDRAKKNYGLQTKPSSHTRIALTFLKSAILATGVLISGTLGCWAHENANSAKGDPKNAFGFNAMAIMEGTAAALGAATTAASAFILIPGRKKKLAETQSDATPPAKN